jgi:hypothetical protein
MDQEKFCPGSAAISPPHRLTVASLDADQIPVERRAYDAGKDSRAKI